MIRCLSCNTLVPRYPCQRCRTDKRNKQVAKAVIARDGKCWRCGATQNLDSAHIIPKAHGGPDTMQNQRAECASYNRGGRCQQ
jgi:5-methylcytosine-specific restriction endonuclease McrA